MERTLQSLFELDGVQGAMIIGPGGRIIQRKVHTIFDNAALDEAGRAVEKAVESLQVHHGDWDGLVIHYSEGKAMIRNLGEGHLLQVIADNTVNLAFANVATNVAYKKLQAMLESGQLKGMADSAGSGGGTVSAGPATQSVSSAPGVLSNSTFGEISMTSDVKDFLKVCSKAMAQSVGPMARVLVKEAVVNLAREGRFTNEQIPDLVSTLEGKLGSPGDVADFRKKVGV